ELDARRGAWTDALDVSARFPLTGTGLNTYGVATILYQRHDLEHHYEQAHNDYLQLMAEGGVLLAVPAALCLGVFAHTVRRRFRERIAAPPPEPDLEAAAPSVAARRVDRELLGDARRDRARDHPAARGDRGRAAMGSDLPDEAAAVGRRDRADADAAVAAVEG